MKEISILYLLKLLKKHILVVLLSAIVLGATAFSYCNFFATPKFSATTSIIISNGAIINSTTSTGNGKDSNSDFTASNVIAENCVEILNTPEMIKLVADKAGIKNHNLLRNSFRIRKRAENIIILDVTATALSPEDAVKLSKIFASLSPEYLSAIFPNVLVNVVAEAEGAVVVSPRTLQTTAVGFLVGLFLSYIIYLIFDMFDQTVHTEDDLSDNFPFAILGVIPDFLTAPAGGYSDGDK